ncbi:hypothetical protein H0H93_011046 [Arthromyces matolae]|nr:hypothetical protein H0H93_011046 [Arthromyces matolae]
MSIPEPEPLLAAFRDRFHQFRSKIQQVVENPTDAVVIQRISDDLDEYSSLVDQHSGTFSANELSTLRLNLAVMQSDIRQLYQTTLAESHHGHPQVIQVVETGSRGRPRILIDPEFLRWAYTMRSTTSIAHFLGVSRAHVRNQLLALGISQPQAQPHVLSNEYREAHATDEEDGQDDLLDPPLEEVFPDIPDAVDLTDNPAPHTYQSSPSSIPIITSYTRPVSTLTDEELDTLILGIRQHLRQAGLSILNGMLLQLGHRVPRSKFGEGPTAYLDLCLCGITMDSMVSLDGELSFMDLLTDIPGSLQHYELTITTLPIQSLCYSWRHAKPMVFLLESEETMVLRIFKLRHL